MIAVRCVTKVTGGFQVNMGLRQGYPEPLLVPIMKSRLTDQVRQESPCTTVFADDTGS